MNRYEYAQRCVEELVFAFIHQMVESGIEGPVAAGISTSALQEAFPGVGVDLQVEYKSRACK